MIQNIKVLAALSALILLVGAPAAAQQRSPRAPDTDLTENVTRGARLAIENFAGEVVIRFWDRDQIKVTARHSMRTKVAVRNTPTAVEIASRGSSGVPSVDYEITAPGWMSVRIEGTYNFVSVEGAQGEVTASTVRGDILVKGGTGLVRAKSIEGIVTIDGAKGRIQAESVNEGIRITGSTGDITASTTNGDITLTGVEAKSVEVETVNGDVLFDGSLAGGRYRFATHNGDIRVSVPESASATFFVRTYNGDFTTNLPLKGAKPEDASRGRRVTFTLGGGAAEVELESFGGEIVVQRSGTGRRQRE
jgi:hypothetical protein